MADLDDGACRLRGPSGSRALAAPPITDLSRRQRRGRRLKTRYLGNRFCVELPRSQSVSRRATPGASVAFGLRPQCGANRLFIGPISKGCSGSEAEIQTDPLTFQRIRALSSAPRPGGARVPKQEPLSAAKDARLFRSAASPIDKTTRTMPSTRFHGK